LWPIVAQEQLADAARVVGSFACGCTATLSRSCSRFCPPRATSEPRGCPDVCRDVLRASYEYDPGDPDELQVRSHNPYRCPGSPPTFPAEPGVNPTHENHGGGGGGGSHKDVLDILNELANDICRAPGLTIGGQLQYNAGFFRVFGFEEQVNLAFTSHGQVIWTQTAGGVVGGEVIVTSGEGFSAGAAEATDASGLTVNGVGRLGFATGVGVVSGVSYQTGLSLASPSPCSLLTTRSATQ